MKDRATALLRRQQLDRQLKPLRRWSGTPRGGWIKEIRVALGMTTRQLAQRLGAAPSSVSQIQQSEAKRTVSLQSLERVAAALGCRLVYALVPHDGSLEQMVQRRARRVAEQLVRRVSHTMNLENQGVDTRFRETQIRSIAEELVRDLSRELWRSAE